MFTGIIEHTGVVRAIRTEGKNRHLEIESAISPELHIDQSVAHNGVCLTVTRLDGNIHEVTAVEETLNRSTLKDLVPGKKINLERCMRSDGRFDGHIVQGHVDAMGVLDKKVEQEGSWKLTFHYPRQFGALLVDKGSITIDGISLTCFDVGFEHFSVAIIPYTYHHTTIGELLKGDRVNLEFDVIGKYVRRIISLQGRP